MKGISDKRSEKVPVLLKIRRMPGWADHIRNYKVMLDDEEIGEIADGETFEHDVAPGEHTLYLKIDYARSEKIQFSAKARHNVEFVCSCSLTGLRVLILPLYLTVLSARYIKLERVN